MISSKKRWRFPRHKSFGNFTRDRNWASGSGSQWPPGPPGPEGCSKLWLRLQLHQNHMKKLRSMTSNYLKIISKTWMILDDLLIFIGSIDFEAWCRMLRLGLEKCENNCEFFLQIHQGAFVANTPVPSGYELVPWRQRLLLLSCL